MPEREETELGRRTIVRGAAWSVPVLATVVAAPAAAASAARVLSFVRPAYSPSSTCAITDVCLLLLQGEAPVAGEPVTVALPGDWTVEGKGTYTALTKGDGRVMLPPIRVGARRGANLPLTAMTPTAPMAFAVASAGEAVYTSGGEFSYYDGAGTSFRLPAGSVALGAPRIFQAPNGDVHGFDGSAVITGAEPGAVAYHGKRPRCYYIDYVKDGIPSSMIVEKNRPGPVQRYRHVPFDAKPIGGRYFLGGSGDLFCAHPGAPKVAVMSGIISATGYADARDYYADAISDTGAQTYSSANQSVAWTYPAVPHDARPVGGGFFLSPRGESFSWNALQPVASGVRELVGYTGRRDQPVASFADLRRSDGSHAAYRATETTSGMEAYPSSVPPEADAVGGGFFLTPGGELYEGNQGSRIATDVTSARGYETYRGYWVNYVLNAPCA